MTPRRGRTFGWVKRFHITASLQKAYGLRERWQAGKATTQIAHFDSLLWRIPSIHPYKFDANPQ